MLCHSCPQPLKQKCCWIFSRFSLFLFARIAWKVDLFRTKTAVKGRLCKSFEVGNAIFNKKLINDLAQTIATLWFWPLSSRLPSSVHRRERGAASGHRPPRCTHGGRVFPPPWQAVNWGQAREELSSFRSGVSTTVWPPELSHCLCRWMIPPRSHHFNATIIHECTSWRHNICF